MSDEIAAQRSAIEPIDPRITSIQPGGGVCMSVELFWGYLRRWYLRAFRRGYVDRMRALRMQRTDGFPHDVIDPRDLKFHRNLTGECWAAGDDPFRWRDRIPFARAGLAELVLGGGLNIAAAAVLAFVYWPAAVATAIMAVFVISFFRDPNRSSPTAPGLVVSPADGRVVAVEELPCDEFIDGPAVVIGIFLSIFNVHMNRSPVDARVIGLEYSPGKFLNAVRPTSAEQNERLTLRLEEDSPPYRKFVVRQIAGAIARRIVCWVAPGEELARGTRFGMIKFGSRTELVLPRDDSLVVEVHVGQSVKAGTSVLARYG